MAISKKQSTWLFIAIFSFFYTTTPMATYSMELPNADAMSQDHYEAINSSNAKLSISERSPAKSFALTNSADIHKELYFTLKEASLANLAQVYVDTFVMTDSSIYELLFKIADKGGSKVSLHLNPGHASNKELIAKIQKAKNIELTQGKQHGKRFIIEYKNDNEEKWHRRVFEGSYNPTFNALHNNTELMLVNTNQTPYSETQKHSHKAAKQTILFSMTNIVKKTPKKKKVYDSTEYDINASFAKRIENSKDGTLYIGSMGYNHSEIHNELLAFCLRGNLHMLVDTTTVKTNKILLDELAERGTQIFVGGVTRDKKNKSGTFHKKYLVRVPKNKKNPLVIVQSANLTTQAKNDFNHASYNPQSPELVKEIIKGHTRDCKKGVAYKDYLKTLPKQKGTKRKK